MNEEKEMNTASCMSEGESNLNEACQIYINKNEKEHNQLRSCGSKVRVLCST